MYVTYEELLVRITDLMLAMERAPIVGISGHGGAGKSTLAARLMSDLGGAPEQVIRTDGFYATDAGPESGLFDLHDWPALLDVLRGLRASPAPRRVVYLARTYDGLERLVEQEMPAVIVCEGIRLLRPETLPLLDLAVWIEMTPEDAGQRAVERNRAQGDSKEQLELWESKWIPEAKEYAASVQPERLADVVIPAAGRSRD